MIWASCERSTREKLRACRAGRRVRAPRPMCLWMPDISSATFRAEARNQCLAVARSPQEADDIAFIESMNDWGDA